MYAGYKETDVHSYEVNLLNVLWHSIKSEKTEADF